jgi:hypothetical protein
MFPADCIKLSKGQPVSERIHDASLDALLGGKASRSTTHQFWIRHCWRSYTSGIRHHRYSLRGPTTCHVLPELDLEFCIAKAREAAAKVPSTSPDLAISGTMKLPGSGRAWSSRRRTRRLNPTVIQRSNRSWRALLGSVPSGVFPA